MYKIAFVGLLLPFFALFLTLHFSFIIIITITTNTTARQLFVLGFF